MRRSARAMALTGLTAATFGLLAVSADAHVTVSPNTATKGGYATLTFKVPNERPDASTTTLEVSFPESSPFASISVQPKPGWTYQVEKASLATPISNHGQQVNERVAKITWTAAGEATQIKPGEFDTFPISAGPLPSDASSLTFKALQTYSNGEIVRWIEEAAPGAEEPKNPAPTLSLTDPAPETPGAQAAPGSTAAPTTGSTSEEVPSDSTSTTAALDQDTKDKANLATGLAALALVLAFIGAAMGGVALSRRPKRPTN